MNNLDKLLKEYSLVFTNTTTREDFWRNNSTNYIEEKEINYEKCTSLFDLINSFNKLYMMFKKEYDELEKLDLGKSVEVIEISKFTYDNDNYRVVRLYIDEPKITNHPYTVLHLREINGEMKSFVTNEKDSFDKNYYRDHVKLDNELSKKYLDFFLKYQDFFEAYRYLRAQYLYGDGSYCAHSRIGKYGDQLLDGLYNFKIIFGDTYSNFFRISINLGKNFGIDYDNCSYEKNGEKISLTKEECIEILKKTYINKEYTKRSKKH